MTSFPNPARPFPGAFPSSLGGMRAAVPGGNVSARVVMVRPAGGKVVVPGDVVEFAAAVLATPSSPVDRVDWKVQVFREARAAPHPHFWYERETPYRTVSRTLSVGETLAIPSEEAERGYSTWAVRVDAYSGSVPVASALSLFSVEVGVHVVPGVMVDSLQVASPEERGRVLPAPRRAVPEHPGVLLPPVLVAVEAMPAVLLDPTPGA